MPTLSYGFRIGGSTHDAIEQCFTDLNKGKSPEWILEGDIKGCFDHISHEWLLENIPMDTQILEKWLKCGYVETRKLFPTDEGAPQGGIISHTYEHDAGRSGTAPSRTASHPTEGKWTNTP